MEDYFTDRLGSRVLCYLKLFYILYNVESGRMIVMNTAHSGRAV
jgi:hypothetical protein